MSWGYRIALLYGGFVAFMLYLVVMCVRQDDIHLVSKNYYEQEIAYQNIIDQKANAQKAGKLKVKQDQSSIQIHFPDGLKAASGEITFFRPSDAKMDVKKDFHLLKSMDVNMSKTKLQKGLWDIKVSCSKGNQKYYYERSITIQ